MNLYDEAISHFLDRSGEHNETVLQRGFKLLPGELVFLKSACMCWRYLIPPTIPVMEFQKTMEQKSRKHLCWYQGSYFWLQSEGGLNSGWCISGGNYSHLLGKEL
jgi:hypothetical protein